MCHNYRSYFPILYFLSTTDPLCKVFSKKLRKIKVFLALCVCACVCQHVYLFVCVCVCEDESSCLCVLKCVRVRVSACIAVLCVGLREQKFSLDYTRSQKLVSLKFLCRCFCLSVCLTQNHLVFVCESFCKQKL